MGKQLEQSGFTPRTVQLTCPKACRLTFGRHCKRRVSPVAPCSCGRTARNRSRLNGREIGLMSNREPAGRSGQNDLRPGQENRANVSSIRNSKKAASPATRRRRTIDKAIPEVLLRYSPLKSSGTLCQRTRPDQTTGRSLTVRIQTQRMIIQLSVLMGTFTLIAGRSMIAHIDQLSRVPPGT